MVEPLNHKPAFFKVLNDDFTTRLRLPPFFTWKLGQLLPESPVLAIGSESLWQVRIEKVEEHQCFTKGWTKFVKDLRLERHDFLVFWFEYPSKFLVEVYAEDGTVKIMNLLTSDDVSSKGEKKTTPPTTTASFSVTMKPANKYRVTIPSTFIRECGMVGRMCLVLKDPQEREWPVLISSHGGESAERTDMSKGWTEFRGANGLVNGDTCIFTAQSENNNGGWLLHVHVKRASEAVASIRPKRARITASS